MPKRYCLLDCEDAEKWKGHEKACVGITCKHLKPLTVIFTHHHHSSQYYKQLFEPDAHWDIYQVAHTTLCNLCTMYLVHTINHTHLFCTQCYNGALPPLDALPSYTAIFLTGSHYSAYERRTWIKQLKAYLRTAILGRKLPMKLVAICFGSQLVAEALGGRVGPNPDGAFVLQGGRGGCT